MNPSEVQSLFWGLLGGILSITGAAIAVSNWLNNKFDAVRNRQYEAESRFQIELEKLKSNGEVDNTRELSHFDMLDYKTNANRELIEHKAKRFFDDLRATEARLLAEVGEIKGFLSKTTEFQIRLPRQYVDTTTEEGLNLD